MTKVSCEEIKSRTEIAKLLALQLYEYFSLEFVVAVVRKLFVKSLVNQ